MTARFKTLLVTLIAVASSATLIGCAAPPLTPQARSHYDASAQATAQNGVALLVDSCLYRLELGTSHIYPQLSEQHARAASRAAAASLEGRGVKVKSVHTPFVCSGLESDYVLSLKQAQAPGAELKPIETYPLRTSAATLRASEEPQWLSFMKVVNKAAPTADRKPDDPVKPVPLDITAEQAQSLSQRLGASHVWVLDLRQQDVSAGRIVGMITLTAGLTAGLTGGAYAGWSTSEDAIGETTALVDLDKREVLWKRQFKAVNRGLVDFERPMASEEQLRAWADAAAFSPFYEAPPKP